MQKQQASGIDKLMMIPVYSMIYAICTHCFLPWISIPSLQYSKSPSQYTIFSMQGFLWMKWSSALLILLMAGGILLLFLKREKSKGYLRFIFGVQFLYTILQQAVVLKENFCFNDPFCRNGNFMSQTGRYKKRKRTAKIYRTFC